MADKPIGAWGGHWGMQIPGGTAAVDAAHQQIPPVSALGSEYVAVRYRSREPNREETVPWRAMGVVGAPRSDPSTPWSYSCNESLRHPRLERVSRSPFRRIDTNHALT